MYDITCKMNLEGLCSETRDVLLRDVFEYNYISIQYFIYLFFIFYYGCAPSQD
jgi:hypothetical protein